MSEMPSYNFTIDGNPVPKGRPRFENNNARTPTKTKNHENSIAWQSKGFWSNPPIKDMPVGIELIFYMKRPKKITSKTVGSCDLDNLIKCALDGMQKIIFADDRQIVKIYAEKHYNCPPNKPRTEVMFSY